MKVFGLDPAEAADLREALQLGGPVKIAFDAVDNAVKVKIVGATNWSRPLGTLEIDD